MTAYTPRPRQVPAPPTVVHVAADLLADVRATEREKVLMEALQLIERYPMPTDSSGGSYGLLNESIVHNRWDAVRHELRTRLHDARAERNDQP